MAFEGISTETILSGRSDWIEADLAERLAHHPLDSVETEFPHYVRQLDSPDGIERPKERHPVFYGCYDWHSSVHSHWALVRQLRLFENHPNKSEIIQSIDRRFKTENIEVEIERFEENKSFEKPYGWGWFLSLASELYLWDSQYANEWKTAIEPLEQTIIRLVKSEFLSQERPFRVGTHENSAFALHCILDYARTTNHDSLATAAAETAIEFFGQDRNYPVEYEPLGWDFLSPTLTEADLMRRVYNRSEFRTWLEKFLPDITSEPYTTLFDPVEVESDPDEGIALHFVGLNISKAWCMAGIASHLDGHRYTEVFEQGAKQHAETGLEQAFTEDYAGSHWLSSFVLYLFTRNEEGIAPT